MSSTLSPIVPRAARLLASLAGVALLALAASAPANAAAGYRALCSGTYCFNVSTFIKSRTVDGAGLWDIYYFISYGGNKFTHYNIRVRNANGQESQFEVSADGARSQIRSFGIKPGHVYVVSSQACSRQFLGSSTCTGWRTTRFTAPKA